MLLAKKMAEVARRTFLAAHATWQKAWDEYMTAQFDVDTAFHKANHAYDVKGRAKADMNIAQNEFYTALEDRIEAEFNLKHNVVSPDLDVVSHAVVAAGLASFLAAGRVQKTRTVDNLAYAKLVRTQNEFYAAMESQRKAYMEWDHIAHALAPILAASERAMKDRDKANTALWVAEAARRKAKAVYLARATDSADRHLLREVHLKYIAVPTAVPTTVPTGEE